MSKLENVILSSTILNLNNSTFAQRNEPNAIPPAMCHHIIKVFSFILNHLALAPSNFQIWVKRYRLELLQPLLNLSLEYLQMLYMWQIVQILLQSDWNGQMNGLYKWLPKLLFLQVLPLTLSFFMTALSDITGSRCTVECPAGNSRHAHSGFLKQWVKVRSSSDVLPEIIF